MAAANRRQHADGIGRNRPARRAPKGRRRALASAACAHNALFFRIESRMPSALQPTDAAGGVRLAPLSPRASAQRLRVRGALPEVAPRGPNARPRFRSLSSVTIRRTTVS